MNRGFQVTAELLRDAVNSNIEAVNDKTLLSVFEKYQAVRRQLIGKKIVQDTFDDNQLTGRYLKEFLKTKYKREDMNLR